MEHQREKLQSLYDQIDQVLQKGIIPFWLERSLDKQNGGYLTNFDGDGNHLGTPEKYLNTQCRLIWWFSILARNYPEGLEYRQMAAYGIEFLYRYFWDTQFGGWFWKIRGDGSNLDDGKSVYGQSFAIYALSEYARATKDQQALCYATKTFDLLQIYCADTLGGGYFENFERDWSIAGPGCWGGDRKGLDTHMHLMESFTTLCAATGQEVHLRRLEEQVQLIVKYLIDQETGCGLNQVDARFQPIPAIALNRTWNAERVGDKPPIPTDTTSYGHNVELSWLINLALKTAEVDDLPYRSVMKRLLDHAYEHGIDWEFGGIYRDGTAKGGPVILEKEFWQNAEALVGFLDGYQTFKDEKYLEAFENIWGFANNHMVHPRLGEFRILLSREGRPIDANLGNPWKVAYHTGRALLECSQRLSSLLG